MTIVDSNTTAVTDRDPGFSATLRSEWDKARTARAPRRNLILGTVLGVGLSLLLSFAVAATFEDWTAGDRATFDPVVYPMSGSLLLVIFYIAAVVGLVVPEYSTGMIRLTFTVTPKRWRVLGAKVLVAAIATGIGTLIALAGMIGGSQLIFASYDLPTADLGSWDIWRALIMLVITGTIFPVLAVAVAFMSRSAAASVAIALAFVFAPSMFGGLLPAWWERNIVSLLPGPAADALSIGHLSESPQHLAPLPAALVVVVWLVGALVLTHRVINSRDA